MEALIVLNIEESYLESVEGEVQLIDLGAVKVERLVQRLDGGLQALDVLLGQPGLHAVHQLGEVRDGDAGVGVLLGQQRVPGRADVRLVVPHDLHQGRSALRVLLQEVETILFCRVQNIWKRVMENF